MNKIINSDALDALRKLPDSCCRTCITSPHLAEAQRHAGKRKRQANTGT